MPIRHAIWKVAAQPQPLAESLLAKEQLLEKAVNPNKQAEEDARTPAEQLDIIEAKGREVAEALAVLRSL